MSNPAPWLISFFMPHSKWHEKTISFLEEAKAYGSIDSHCSQVELDKHHSTVPGQTGRHYGKAVACWKRHFWKILLLLAPKDPPGSLWTGGTPESYQVNVKDRIFSIINVRQAWVEIKKMLNEMGMKNKAYKYVPRNNLVNFMPQEFRVQAVTVFYEAGVRRPFYQLLFMPRPEIPLEYIWKSVKWDNK